MKHLIPLLLIASPALAEAPQIEAAEALRSGDTWRVSVTLSHPDTGWDHYADGWRVEDASGRVLATRVLVHPHVQEQPFTRSQSGIVIPEGVSVVYVRSRCLVDGWSQDRVELPLP